MRQADHTWVCHSFAVGLVCSVDLYLLLQVPSGVDYLRLTDVNKLNLNN